MVVSVDKLKELASRGVGSKKACIEYRKGNALSVFSRHEKTPFDLFLADTGPHFIPFLDIQKNIWSMYPQLNGMSEDRGSLKVIDVVNEIKVVAKKDAPTKYSKEFERKGKVGVLVFHYNEVVTEEEKQTYNVFQAFEDSVSKLVDYCIKNKIKRIGTNIIGTQAKWLEYSKIIENVCDKKNFTGLFIVYKPKKARS